MRHYLDHASTAPLRDEARAAMVDALAQRADPSRLHDGALEARYALETARESVAGFLGARPREVVFTSGATESIVAVCSGVGSRGDHQVVTAVEHSAVRHAAERWAEVDVVGVDRYGRVDDAAVADRVGERTAVVHVQSTNHEVGTRQPVDAVVAAVDGRGLVHVDACQSVGREPFDFAASGVDLVSFSGHKVGGPTGIGVLLVRRGLRLQPLLVGADQERARRAGMENVAAAVGLAAALGAIDIDAESRRQRSLTDSLRRALLAIDGVVPYGHPTETAPHIVCVGIVDVEPQAVVLGLNRAGVAAHSGSACASEGLEPSPVLEAMGVDAHHSLRLSVGWSSTEADVTAAAEATAAVVDELRRLRR